MEGIWAANPDYHEELHELIAEGDFVVARLIISGLQSSQWGRLPPSSERVETEEILIVEIRQGKIVRQHGVVDVLPMLRQLGAIPARS